MWIFILIWTCFTLVETSVQDERGIKQLHQRIKAKESTLNRIRNLLKKMNQSIPTAVNQSTDASTVPIHESEVISQIPILNSTGIPSINITGPTNGTASSTNITSRVTLEAPGNMTMSTLVNGTTNSSRSHRRRRPKNTPLKEIVLDEESPSLAESPLPIAGPVPSIAVQPKSPPKDELSSGPQELPQQEKSNDKEHISEVKEEEAPSPLISDKGLFAPEQVEEEKGKQSSSESKSSHPITKSQGASNGNTSDPPTKAPAPSSPKNITSPETLLNSAKQTGSPPPNNTTVTASSPSSQSSQSQSKSGGNEAESGGAITSTSVTGSAFTSETSSPGSDSNTRPSFKASSSSAPSTSKNSKRGVSTVALLSFSIGVALVVFGSVAGFIMYRRKRVTTDLDSKEATSLPQDFSVHVHNETYSDPYLTNPRNRVGLHEAEGSDLTENQEHTLTVNDVSIPYLQRTWTASTNSSSIPNFFAHLANQKASHESESEWIESESLPMSKKPAFPPPAFPPPATPPLIRITGSKDEDKFSLPSSSPPSSPNSLLEDSEISSDSSSFQYTHLVDPGLQCFAPTQLSDISEVTELSTMASTYITQTSRNE